MSIEITSKVFLEEFYAQIYSLRELNKTEKRIVAGAIELGITNAKLLAEELNIPRSTSYHRVTQCLRKLSLIERTSLRWYAMGLEPIKIFFRNINENNADVIEQYFRNTPYFYNSARLVTPENEQAHKDVMTLSINLRFPGAYTWKLRTQIKNLIEEFQIQVHWFRYDRMEHGYNLQRFGIDTTKHRNFDIRGEVISKQVPLLPGDLSIIAYRLFFTGSRPAPPLEEIARLTKIKVNRLFSTQQQLFPKITAGNDISIVLANYLPVNDFRLILQNPTPKDIQYIKSAFPEYYLYYDVNDRELLVLLMIPTDYSTGIEAFMANHADRILLQGLNTGLTYSHFFNLANLEAEFDYDTQKWKDPFRSPERWKWPL